METEGSHEEDAQSHCDIFRYRALEMIYRTYKKLFSQNFPPIRNSRLSTCWNNSSPEL